MERSLALCLGVLGFKTEWQGEPPGGIAGLRRDGVPVMLPTLHGAGPCLVWIGLSDVRTIHEAILGQP